MMSRRHNLPSHTARQGLWAVLCLGWAGLWQQVITVPTIPAFPALVTAAATGGSLSAKRYPQSFMDLGSESANR